MWIFLKLLKTGLIFTVTLVLLAGIAATGLFLYLGPQLPSIAGLSDVKLQVPLRIYSSDGALLGEFGEKRRNPKRLDELPPMLWQAFLASEDDRFFEHPGVDYRGILRAAYHLVSTGERGQGGSTITMQLARNFYLSREKTYIRKMSEIFLALKIEQALNKERILELYLNKIYLGNRSYGVAAASRVYYGKQLDELNLSQIAMIAGLPKAPSRYNPIINPDRAVTRRDYVLSRMAELEYISEADLRWARAQPVTAGLHDSPIEIRAPYLAEMVRTEIVKQFGDEAYTRGLKVYTTIESKLQKAASDSLRKNLLDYDQRHGYRGVIAKHTISGVEDQQAWEDILTPLDNFGQLMPALVIEVGGMSDPAGGAPEPLEADKKETDIVEADKTARVYLAGGRLINLDWAALSWAKPYVSVNRQGEEPARASDVVSVGDVVYVYRNLQDQWQLGQAPEVQGALVALSPNNGAIRALVGGFDFNRSKFNRALQAKRQAGSSFKPFIYAAALNRGYTASTIINDAPVVFEDKALEGTWRPENYSGKFYGPTRLREALVKSRNLVSIRLLRAVGVRNTIDFAEKFGFEKHTLPHDLSLALGSSDQSPIELARGFAVFANGGYRVDSYFIKNIKDVHGVNLFDAEPLVACVSCELGRKNIAPPVSEDEMPFDAGTPHEERLAASLPKQAEQTVDSRIIHIMNSMMQDVIKRGTARRANKLGRGDLAGKTGTTNDQKDAWFNGYNADLVATTWVGFDLLKPLGDGETGSRAALPMWIDFMGAALKGKPDHLLPTPEDLVTVKIDPETGQLASSKATKTVFEIFRADNAPKAENATRNPGGRIDSTTEIPEQLF